jgi:hypothetical protein
MLSLGVLAMERGTGGLRNRTTESQSARSTNGRRTTICMDTACDLFLRVLEIREIARLCELCASVVNNSSCIIKTEVCELVNRLCAFFVALCLCGSVFWG